MNIKLLFPLLLAASFTVLPCAAQLEGKPFMDSLINVLNNTENSIKKMQLLGELAYDYKNADPSEGIKYSRLLMDEAVATNSKKAQALAYRYLGLNYYELLDYPKSLDNFYKALNLSEEVHNTDLSAEVISDMAVLYTAQGDYEKSLEYNNKCLALDRQAKRRGNEAGDLGNIGNVYMSMHKYEEALKYDEQSLKIFEELKDKKGIANNLGNIANVYEAQNKLERSLQQNMKVLPVFKELEDNEGVANTLGNMGVVYLDAITDTDEGIRKSPVFANKNEDAIKGIDLLKQGISLSEQIGLMENIIDFSRYIATADSLLGNYKEALTYYQRFANLKDSIYSSSNKIQIANIEAKGALEIKFKELQIETLEAAKRTREKILWLIAIIAFVLIIVVVIRQFKTQYDENKQLAKEKTAHLKHIREQTDVLSDIAYKQSHEVRAPIATILGLVQLFNLEDPADPINKDVIEGIAIVTGSLDEVIQEVIRIENNYSSQNSEI